MWPCLSCICRVEQLSTHTLQETTWRSSTPHHPPPLCMPFSHTHTHFFVKLLIMIKIHDRRLLRAEAPLAERERHGVAPRPPHVTRLPPSLCLSPSPCPSPPHVRQSRTESSLECLACAASNKPPLPPMTGDCLDLRHLSLNANDMVSLPDRLTSLASPTSPLYIYIYIYIFLSLYPSLVVCSLPHTQFFWSSY